MTKKMKFSQTKGTKKGSRLKGDQLGGGWMDLSSELIRYGGDFAAYFEWQFFHLANPKFHARGDAITQVISGCCSISFVNECIQSMYRRVVR